MPKKINKIIPYSDEWEMEAGYIARNYCPTIYPCQKCSHPVVRGYCCTICGDSNPSEKETGSFNISENK